MHPYTLLLAMELASCLLVMMCFSGCFDILLIYLIFLIYIVTHIEVLIALMHVTKTLHPPGGPTALIAVIGGPKIHDLGFFYAVLPVGAGVVVMLLIAPAVNNVLKSRRYPEIWI